MPVVKPQPRVMPMPPVDPTSDARREFDDSEDGSIRSRQARMISMLTDADKPTVTQEPSGGKQSRISRIAEKVLKPLKALTSLLSRASTPARSPQPDIPSPPRAAPVFQMADGTDVHVDEATMNFVSRAPVTPGELSDLYANVPRYAGSPPWLTKSDPSTIRNPTHIAALQLI